MVLSNLRVSLHLSALYRDADAARQQRGEGVVLKQHLTRDLGVQVGQLKPELLKGDVLSTG